MTSIGVSFLSEPSKSRLLALPRPLLRRLSAHADDVSSRRLGYNIIEAARLICRVVARFGGD